MARLTITDCLKNVKDKYELIVLAGQRSRQLYAGKTPTIEVKDRTPVVSLREIAKNTIDTVLLEKNLIKSFRETKEPDFEEKEEISDELKQIEEDLK